ncbi:MAG: SDR family oxidoreductase [Gammaproteobacteria bacterium]|nr:SDR family oxidoreductase [Gammaproteobacteria bacterium]
MVDLRGRVALVTGAGRGIGRAIALQLAAAGAAVAVNFHVREDAAQRVVGEIRARGGASIAVRADVSAAAEVEAMVAMVERELGPIDVLINNAGVAVTRGLDEIDEAEFDRTIAVNLKSAFLCTQAVLRSMRARRWGRIVNLSSVAARGGGAIGVHYNASKAAIEGLTRGYAARLATEGVTVNAIAPGPVDTEMAAAGLPPDIASRVPLGRIGRPEEIAEAALLVLGNAFMTGQVVHVNGGLLFA